MKPRYDTVIDIESGTHNPEIPFPAGTRRYFNVHLTFIYKLRTLGER